MNRLALLMFLVLALLHGGCEDAPQHELRAKAIELLKISLSDTDRGVRHAAVTALGKAGEATKTLGPLLHDSAWCVRQEAAWWLRQEGGKAVSVLGSAFAKGDPEARASVAWALSGLEYGGVALLEKAIRDADLSVRLEALCATQRLGAAYGSPLAIAVRQSLKSESSEERYEAALALSEIAPSEATEALPVLLGAANKNTSHADREALKALHKCGASSKVFAGLSKSAKNHVSGARAELERERRGLKRKFARHESPVPLAETPHTFVAAPGTNVRLGSGKPSERVHAALDLGRAESDASVLVSALKDRERDVRLAVAMGLGTATGNAIDPLARLIADNDSRVRAAAIRSLGMQGAPADRVAPFLADPVFAVALAAHDALREIGPMAAKSVAQQMNSANYAVLQHAVSLFQVFGIKGGNASSSLSALLGHADANVRESAARCLTFLGASGKGSAPSLVRALSDDRLSVVSHAALALGSQGVSQESLVALSDRRARVRAYAAFALGWSLGAKRRIDQVPFEVRLPVLAVRDIVGLPTSQDMDALDTMKHAQRTPVLLRGIWSANPAISVRCASLLEYEQLDAVQSERVMELLLPEGLRSGSKVDFDRLRSILGSSELCACMNYVVRASRTRPGRRKVFNELHRIARAEHLSPLCWFRRMHEKDVLEGDGYPSSNIWMPASYAASSARDRATSWLGYDPGPNEGTILRALLHAWLTEPEVGLAQPRRWLLNRFQPHDHDGALLLRTARVLEKGEDFHSPRGAYFAALRALGRCSDVKVRTYLRGVAKDGDEHAQLVALAGLARQGEEEARRSLVKLSLEDHHAFLLLMEIEPRTATTLLGDLLINDETWEDGLGLLFNWSATAAYLGVEFPSESFMGLESAMASAKLAPQKLSQIAIEVPGCWTKRIAALLFDGLEAPGAANPISDEDDNSWGVAQDEVGAFLCAADPRRFVKLLRQWASEDHEAHQARHAWSCHALLRLADTSSAIEVIAWLRREHPQYANHCLLEHLPGPEAEAYLRDYSVDDRNYAHLQDSALEAVARMRGWPASRPFSITEDFPADQQKQVRAWLREGSMGKVKTAFDAIKRESTRKPVLVWKEMLAKTNAGDAHARAALWSVLRCGRYRWCQIKDDRVRTLGTDWTTLPHWVSDLDSNCCRVADGLEAYVFKRCFGAPTVEGSERNGVAQPLSQRMTTWLSMMGGRWVHSPLVDRWVSVPE